jgi:hypothetical protein
MTVEEVTEIVRLQAADDLRTIYCHGITLEQALVAPKKISVIARSVRGSKISDQQLEVWLVGLENSHDGYKIIMRDDGLQFGLASHGFPSDKHPILVGWYGSLRSACIGM